MWHHNDFVVSSVNAFSLIISFSRQLTTYITVLLLTEWIINDFQQTFRTVPEFSFFVKLCQLEYNMSKVGCSGQCEKITEFVEAY